MKILLLSDIHDHMEHLERLLVRKISCDIVLGCGDYCAPFVVRRLAQAFDCPIHLVWGNNDGDRAMHMRIARDFAHLHLEGEYLDAQFEGRRVFVNHYPAIARAVVASGQHALVAYGHDHRRHEERIGSSILINPGSLMGYQPTENTYHIPTAVMYDTISHGMEWVELG